MTPDVLGKLEDAFINAFTDEMACLYAGINPDTLYSYCKENPKFSERKEALKNTPNLKAQQTLVKDLDNTGGARWWAERKMPEFQPKQKVEHSGKIEAGATPEATAAVRDVVARFETELRDTITKGIKAKPR